MNIDWASVGAVFGVSLLATVGLVGLFALGTVGLAKQGSALVSSASYACFALCAAAVGYGIYLIVA
ncbi:MULTISPECIES: hypothetical protein [Streptomyces]|uniref:Uncharacterized protein n=1 Tax=Streptomyces montanisoli TaxID=2798581 RepID=A0A940MDT9_9ACTN|nr:MULTISPECIES: hypothetical protein [Streptomyces]MBP0461130.1 hypothetical protein [Streptomyces montanisoli]